VSRSARALVAVVLTVTLGACTSSGSPRNGSSPAPTVPLTVGLGYIPSVQFAPFYYGQARGLYAACGLQVTFQNQIDPNLITLVGQGAIDIGLADGTSVVPAVSQGIPIKYLATVYGTFPNVVISLLPSGISSAADLKGKRIGIPGRYGSSWVMLQALLGSANLTPADVTIVEYPDFGQGSALARGQVDAATAFDNNEPIQLARQLEGTGIVRLRVDSVIHLPGPGLIAGSATLQAKRDAIQGFVAATLRAMRDIAADPAKGVDASIKAVPDLAKDRATQEAILQATIGDWTTPGGSASTYGAIDGAGWQATITYLASLGMVPKAVTVDDVIDDLSAVPTPAPS